MEANLLNIPQVTQLFFRFDFSFNPGFAVIKILDQYFLLENSPKKLRTLTG